MKDWTIFEKEDWKVVMVLAFAFGHAIAHEAFKNLLNRFANSKYINFE